MAALALAMPAFAESRLVHIEGKNFIAPDGSILHIKGISLGNWLMPEGYMFKFEVAKAPRQIYDAFDRLLGSERAAAFWKQYRDTYIARDDIQFIKSVGFNTVRIPLHWDLFMAEDGTIEGPGWALLDRMLGWIKAAGLYAIVDLHAAPGGQTGINHDDGPGYPLMFYVPRDRDLTVKLWQAIAQVHAGDPTILGYDLLNEPIAPYHDTATLNSRLEPFYKRLTAAIRSVDPGRVMILAAGQWSSSFDMFGPPFARNLAYTYHSFWASTKRDSIQRHLNFSNLYDVPLFLGETGELTDDWNAGFRKLHEAHGIGWSFWTYKNLDTPSTVVSIKRPDGWDEIVAFADGKRRDKPSDEVIARAMAQYLDGMRLANATVRWSYLASLGLKSAP
jgi:aryl-phospho-beta-D-glucosidase BglC (GH1 family)